MIGPVRSPGARAAGGREEGTMVRKHPVGSFFALTYLITWPLQVAALFLAGRDGFDLSNEDNYRHFTDIAGGELAAGLLAPFLLFNLGQFGPALAALVLIRMLYGSAGLSDWAARIAAWRRPVRWYGIVLVIPVLLALASLALGFLLGGMKFGEYEPRLALAAFVPFLLYMIVFTGLAEEPGWRGFALPHLQAKNTAARSSWILGFAWGLWHVPFTLYFNRDEPILILPALLGLTFGIVGWTMVNTWIYNSSESTWLIILLHGWGNAVQSYLVLSQSNFVAHTLYGLLPWAIAVYLSKKYGDENLSGQPRPKWWPGTYPVEQREAVA
jgi:membrane protease YdiL (CAAX protease family)